jgi:methionine-rich copper-binding protein CopC
MIRRAVAVVLLAGIALIAGQGTADAHAILVQSSPAAGSTLATAPAAITLTFDESVLVRAALSVDGDCDRACD